MTTLANPGGAAPFQLPAMDIPTERCTHGVDRALLLAASGTQPFQPAFEHVLAT